MADTTSRHATRVDAVTGSLFAFGACFGCGGLFGFDPDLVPSLDGRPICGSCMERANRLRAEAGQPPHRVLPGAYGPVGDVPG